MVVTTSGCLLDEEGIQGWWVPPGRSYAKLRACLRRPGAPVGTHPRVNEKP